jgi:hypothetical protein
MSEFYMMDSWGLKGGEPTQKPRHSDFVKFLLGRSIENLCISTPIKMQWEEEVAGGGLAWLLEGSPSEGPRNQKGVRRKWAYDACIPPLFHKSLVNALRESGVDNLETFDVCLLDTITNEVCDDYQAVNIVGLIKAVDMSKSIAMVYSEDGLFDTDFASVKLNEEVIRGVKMFRLAESVNAVVVHRSVKAYLESKGGFELTFTEPEKWIG